MMVGKEVRRFPKLKKEPTKIKFNPNIGWYLIFFAGVLGLVVNFLIWYNNWSAHRMWQKPWHFNMEFYFKELVVDRPEPEWISPVVEVMEESDIEIDSPIDQKIYDLFGDRYFLLARSIFKCESGLNPEAVNWGSKDIGVAQVNYPIWKDKIAEKFGYSLVDLFDPDKNLEVAYYIWDRADGEEGNGKGSFEPWVVYQNGNFVGCVD